MRDKARSRKRCTAVLALGAALLFVLPPAAPGVTHRQAVEKPQQVWGYQPWWMMGNWSAVDLGLWRRVLFFELQVGADGSIANLDALPPGWQSMRQAVERCSRAMDLTFTLFDATQFEQLFTTPEASRALLANVIAMADATSADGVHIDFEIFQAVTPQAVAGFRRFLGALAGRLRQGVEHARVLSMFGVVGAPQELLDTATVRLLDFIVIQGYDAHWKGSGTAGPVAPLHGGHPLAWTNSLQHYLGLGARRSQLLFSIPYYGYEWPVASGNGRGATTGPGSEISYAPLPAGQVPRISSSAVEQSARHGVQRDRETNSPYYVYRSGSAWREGWYEDELSLREKIAFIEREQLAGVAAFPLGYDGGRFDSLLGSAFGRRAACRPRGAATPGGG